MKSPKLSPVFSHAKFLFSFLLLNISYANAADMVDLGSLGGLYSEPYSISSNGKIIVGFSTETGGPANTEYPFIYNNGVLTKLNFGGTGNSTAFGISPDASIIVGLYTPDGVNQHALSYSNGIVTDLGTLPGQTSSVAYAISSDKNVIIGDSGNNAFKYIGGVMNNIGSLGGDFVTARGVSADGSVIVGYSDTVAGVGFNFHAFKYEGTTMSDLGTLGGSESTAFGISADGTIILGKADIVGDGAHHAFKYQDGVMTDLGTLGGTNSDAYQISDDNKVIIGLSDTAGDVAEHAFLIRIDSINPVDINNTATAIASSSRQLNSIINLNENSLNFALRQDATVFGANNLSVSIGSRYTQINPYSTKQIAATLKIAYRFNENLRAGIFLDQATNNNMPNNYALKNTQPIIGIFTTLTQKNDDTGAQLRLAAAYNSADLRITRTTLANTEAGMGSSSLTSKGAIAEASYGFKLTENSNIRPLVGLRFTKVSRDSYVENSGADFPISYKNIEKRSTTGLAGLQLSGAITTNLSLQTRLVFEHDLNRSIDNYEGDVSYLGSFDIAAPHLQRNRGVASFGGAYKIDKTQEVGFGAIYSQHSLNGNNAITTYLNYAIGL